MSLVFLMQGYGGCFNPPCRQRPSVLIRLVSRAFMVCQPAMVFARPADDFGFFRISQSRPAVRVSASEAMLGYLSILKLAVLVPLQVILTDENFYNGYNCPVIQCWQGF